MDSRGRSLKSGLGLRPVYHQLARRTAAHLFISVLAYNLLCAHPEDKTTTRGAGRQSAKSSLLICEPPWSPLTSDKGVIYHLRASGAPEPAHKEIYRILGVTDPRVGSRLLRHICSGPTKTCNSISWDNRSIFGKLGQQTAF